MAYINPERTLSLDNLVDKNGIPVTEGCIFKVWWYKDDYINYPYPKKEWEYWTVYKFEDGFWGKRKLALSQRASIPWLLKNGEIIKEGE